MSDYETIKFEVKDSIALITLDRPEAAHGINLAMAAELSDVALQCERSSDVKVVVITSTGRLFCGGGDVQEMSEFEDVGLKMKALADGLHRAVMSFANMSAPLIVAVNGTAAGAGFSMALAADYVVAAEGAKFTMAYTKIGLSPDGGASYYLPRVVGTKRAFDLMVTNKVLSTQEAADWGILNQVVVPEALMETAMAVANNIAAGSINSHGAVKQLLKASYGNSLEQQLELEATLIANNASGENGKEGVLAFTEKRAPAFK